MALLIAFLLLFSVIPTAWASEPTTYAVDGNGDGYIEVADAGSLQDLQDFSWALWIKIVSLVGDRPFIYKTPKWLEVRTSGAIRGYVPCSTTTADSETNTSVTTGSWYYIVMTYNHTGDRKIDIYINGEEAVYDSHISSVGTVTADSGNNVFFDRHAGIPTYLDAILDEITIWNRTLSSSEVSSTYNSGSGNYSPSNTTGLVAWYKADEGTGTAVYDRSGNGNDGTMKGGATWTIGVAPDWYDVDADSLYIQPNYVATLSGVSYSVRELTFTLTASSTSTTQVYCANLGEPTSMQNIESLSYDADTDIATITVSHSSATEVKMSWRDIISSGYFVLSVHVKAGTEIVRDASVSVADMAGEEIANKTVNYEGLAQFEVEYGTYRVRARRGEELRQVFVWMTDSKAIGIDFGEPAPYQPVLEGLILVPVIIALAIFWLRRARR